MNVYFDCTWTAGSQNEAVAVGGPRFESLPLETLEILVTKVTSQLAEGNFLPVLHLSLYVSILSPEGFVIFCSEASSSSSLSSSSISATMKVKVAHIYFWLGSLSTGYDDLIALRHPLHRQDEYIKCYVEAFSTLYRTIQVVDLRINIAVLQQLLISLTSKLQPMRLVVQWSVRWSTFKLFLLLQVLIA